MKLDRNIAGNNGRGKYALLTLRKIDALPKSSISAKEVREAIMTLTSHGVLDWGDTPQTEFFVLRLKDQFTLPALKAYANAIEDHDFDFACEVRELARRSGPYSQFCKLPD